MPLQSFNLVNELIDTPDYIIKINKDEQFKFYEENNNGQNKTPYWIIIKSKNGGIQILPFKKKFSPLQSIMKNKKCADGAFITNDDNKNILYIIEMKSSLSDREYNKAKIQITGMYLASIAISSIIELKIDEIKTFICYEQIPTNETIELEFQEQIIAKKMPLGGENNHLEIMLKNYNEKTGAIPAFVKLTSSKQAPIEFINRTLLIDNIAGIW